MKLMTLNLGMVLLFTASTLSAFSLDEDEDDLEDVEDYVLEAEKALKQKSFDKAKIFLDKAGQFNLLGDDIEQVKQVLKKAEAIKSREQQAIIDVSSVNSSDPESDKQSINIPQSSCSSYSTLQVNVIGDLENSPSFSVTPPDGVQFTGGGGVIFSNRNSDYGSVSSYRNNGCIKGSYQFLYSYIDSSDTNHSYSGRFSLDGKSKGYNIDILQGGILSGPSVIVNSW